LLHNQKDVRRVFAHIIVAVGRHVPFFFWSHALEHVRTCKQGLDDFAALQQSRTNNMQPCLTAMHLPKWQLFPRSSKFLPPAGRIC
jgi:hypothetical protein